MRKPAKKGPLSVRAIAGSHVVILAWNVEAASWASFTDDANGDVVERYWLRGMKRFEDKDAGAPTGSPFPLSEHPVQSFQWGDYTPKPEVTYRYRIVPARGKPKNLVLDNAAAVSVAVTTEAEDDGEHGIWFNRGVAASQAYARRFELAGMKPNPDEPESEQMEWLARGLYKALKGFIEKAKGPKFALRGAFYEFKYPPILDVLRAAVDRKVDVSILYDQPSYGDDNEAAIEAAGIGDQCHPRAGSTADKHNKFLVLLKDGEPQCVWTGSTNISVGGIFGHSNLGHVVWDADVARKYRDYWQLLFDNADEPAASIRPTILATTATPPLPPPSGISVMFSPRDGKSLDWYADLMRSASQIVCFTAAFTVAEQLATTLKEDVDALRFVLKDKAGANDADIQRDKDVVVAVGSKFERNEFPGWLGEVLTGFNRNLYIHDKFLLVDPLGEDPIVATGSANFSNNSMVSNDENMLVIRGNTRVADIYFGEFMRIFDHIYARFLVKRALAANVDVSRNFLLPDATWVKRHAGKTSPKAKRRLYFRGED